MKGKTRDGNEPGGLVSGTSHKEKIGGGMEKAQAGPASCGMHSVGKNEKSGANPKTKVSRGHTIW
jgi:hypothetical protein